MIIRRNPLGIFRSIRVFYEDKDIRALIRSEKPDYLTVISRTGASSFPGYTTCLRKKVAVISLNGSVPEVFQRFRKNTRNEIRRTYTIDDLDFVNDDENIEEWYNLYKNFERAQGRMPWKKSTFSGTALFSAYYKGKMIVGLPFYLAKPILTLHTIASVRLQKDVDQDFQKLVGYATRRIVYNVCEYGSKNGYTEVSLSSVNFTDKKKSSVAQFKLSFGCNLVDEYTCIYMSKRLQAINAIQKVFQ